MSKKLFDAFRSVLGRGMTQAEVNKINEALEPVIGEGSYAYPDDLQLPALGSPSRASQAAIDLKKEFEGFERVIGGGKVKSYLCPAKVWTIGFGNTGPDPFNGGKIGLNTVWTFEQAEQAFRLHLAKDEKYVGRMTTGPTSQSQFDALVSLCYNIGPTNLGGSTLIRLHNAGDFEGAAGQFKRWNRSRGKVLNGLTRRRAAEAALYRGEV